MTWALSAVAWAVPVALAIDHWVGEPAPSGHPVVWMGRGLAAVGAPWGGASAQRAFVNGAAAWLAGAGGCAALAWAASRAVDAGAGLIDTPWLRTAVHALLLGALLKPLFAWRMLYDEVAAVEAALAQGTEAGRARLARLVSRDTATLNATEVRESALESLAENLNDSLVAPLFWFAVGGLPAAALYRFANTADAMWGYRGRWCPWEWAGKWAARADDVLSWLPARLTALLLALAGARWPRGLMAEARRTPSPNGGWPMAALAILLGVRLGKPGVYVLNAAGGSAIADSTWRGLRLCRRAAWMAVAAAALAPGCLPW